jgi:hypothetical protein
VPFELSYLAELESAEPEAIGAYLGGDVYQAVYLLGQLAPSSRPRAFESLVCDVMEALRMAEVALEARRVPAFRCGGASPTRLVEAVSASSRVDDLDADILRTVFAMLVRSADRQQSAEILGRPRASSEIRGREAHA